MSNGQILFYSGAALMAATILLAVFFWIKKPKYKPTSAVYGEAEEREMQRQRSGSPDAQQSRKWNGYAGKTDDATEAVAVSTVFAGDATEAVTGSAAAAQEQQGRMFRTQTVKQGREEMLPFTQAAIGAEDRTEFADETVAVTVISKDTAFPVQPGAFAQPAGGFDREADETEIIEEDGEVQNV